MIETAVVTKLAADAEVAAGLATYDYGDGGDRPAIFTNDEAVGETDAPFVIVKQTSTQFIGARDFNAWLITVDVSLIGDMENADTDLRELALEIQSALDKAELSSSDYTVADVRANPPVYSIGPDGFPQYSITVTITAKEA